MIKVNIKLIDRNSERIVASGFYKEFNNIDELITYCIQKSNYQYMLDYEIIK